MRLYFFERLVEEPISEHETWPRLRPGLVIRCGYDDECDEYSLHIYWKLTPRTAVGLLYKHYIRVGFIPVRLRKSRFSLPFRFFARWR